MRIKPNADGHFCSWNSAFLYRWPVGQAVKTAASHAANGSSILPRVTTSEWTTFHSKSPAIRLGFSHTISSFLLFPTKLCKANFCGGPAAGGKRTPRQNGLHSIQKLGQMAGLFSYHFVIPPYPRCRGKTNAPAEWTAFYSKSSAILLGFFLFIRPSRAERIKPGL